MISPLEYLIYLYARKMPVEETEVLFSELRKIGFSEHKYIPKVHNLSGKINYSPQSSPIVHAPELPGTRSMANSYDPNDTIWKASGAMALLALHQHRGYFEVVAQDIQSFKDFALSIERDFPGFKTAEPSPRYRTHFIYEGKPEDSSCAFDCVPSYSNIAVFSQNFNVKIDVIVDYSPTPRENSGTSVVRVATVDHTLREKAIDFHWEMKRLSNRNPIKNDARNYNLLTEQCLVGEPIK